MSRGANALSPFWKIQPQREDAGLLCDAEARAVRAGRHQPNLDKQEPGLLPPGDGATGEKHLRDFQDNEKSIPTVLTTSQKLSTGVDARNVRNIVLMRPVKSMIEFKQIIGRGTRLYEGKDYFTVYDFVMAHKHFSDPEWDGEPLEPENCGKCGQHPCVCEPPPPPPCPVCGKQPCTCEKRNKVKVKLADGKDRTIQHMTVTSFWHPDGTPMSAQQFMESLFGKLPEFFKDEDELRAIWSNPETRRSLLDGLAEQGFGCEQLAEMQKIIEAEKSDIFDVLSYAPRVLKCQTIFIVSCCQGILG